MGTWYEDLYDEFAGRGKSFTDFMGDRFYNAGRSMDRFGTVMGLTRADKNKIEYALAGLPLIGPMLSARDNFNAMEDYMSATGTSWDDMPYPARVSGAGSIGRAAASLGGFVSDNIASLYEDDPAEETNELLRLLLAQQTSQKRYRW